MPRPRKLEGMLLVLLAASLLFGGGLGCEPELEGTLLRAAVHEDVRYVAFTGKKAPGNGSAVLEYPIAPTASIEAKVGVVNPRYLEASEGAEGCIGLREQMPGLDHRICATYELAPPNLRIFSTLGAAEADCPDVTAALLRLEDDGEAVSASYACADDAEELTPLEEVPSQWDEGEKWFPVLAGFGLEKGAEVGFSRLRYTSAGPFEVSVDGNIAFATFNALRLGLEAFHAFGDPEQPNAGLTNTSMAFMQLNSALNGTINNGAFPDTDVEKDLAKARKSLLKLDGKLFPDEFDAYYKAFPKIADLLACAIAEEEDFLAEEKDLLE